MYEEGFKITMAGLFLDTNVKLFLNDSLIVDSTLTSGMDELAYVLYWRSKDKDTQLKFIADGEEFEYGVSKKFKNNLIIYYYPWNVEFILSKKDYSGI